MPAVFLSELSIVLFDVIFFNLITIVLFFSSSEAINAFLNWKKKKECLIIGTLKIMRTKFPFDFF